MIQSHHFQSTPFRFSSFAAIALLSFVAIAARTATAVPIVHGNFPALTVDFLGVQEESATDPGPALFGPPTIAGDSMDFNPQAFAATSTGLDSDQTDSNLQFTIMAKTGKQINNVSFTEAGDTTLTGLAGEAQTTVGATIFIDITQASIGGVLTPVNVNVPIGAMVFAPKSNFLRSVDGAGTKSWTGAVSVNLAPALAAAGINGVATKVFVTLDNTLSAASVAGTSAFIQKKDADGLVVTVNIPEPATFATALMALVIGGGVARRRRS